MNQMVGMDVAVVRQLSVQLRAQSQHLANILGSVDAIVGQAAQQWHGPAAAHFAQRWHGGMKGQLAAARSAIEGLATAAANNANAQAAVSGSAGGAPGGTSGGRGPFVPGKALLGGVEHYLAGVEDSLAPLGFLGGTGTVATFLKSGTTVPGLGKFFDPRNSALLTKGGADLLHHVPSAPLKALDSVGKHVLTPVSVAVDGASAGAAFASGDNWTGVTSSMNVASTALKSKPNPASYLGGVALSVWSDNIQEFRKLDFSSSTMQAVAQYTTPQVVVEEFGKAVTTTLFKLPKWFG